MAEQRFGGDVRIYGKGFVEQQGTGDVAIVARALLNTAITDAKSRASHTGTQLFATISDGATYVDGRIQGIVGAAPAALDTLQEIATQLLSDESAADALFNQVALNRGDLDAVTGRVTQAETDITDLRGDVDALSGTAGTLATQASVDAVTTRVTAVEGIAANAATQTALTTVDGKVTALDTRVGAVETLAGAAATQAALTTATGRITTAEGRLDGFDTTTGTLRTDVNGLRTDADSLRADLTALGTSGGSATAAVAADLAALDTRVGTAEGRLNGLDTTATTLQQSIDDAVLQSIEADQNALGLIAGVRTDFEAADTAIGTRIAATEAVANAAATDADFDAAVASLTAAQNALDARIDALEIPTIFKATVGDGTASVLPVTHGLNSTDVELIVRDLTDGQRVFPVDVVTGANALSLDFGSYVPAANSIRVIVKAL
jgi:hypothetical protein